MIRVFVLMAHFYVERQFSFNLMMIGASSTRSIMDIKGNVETHSDIVRDLLPVHALSK